MSDAEDNASREEILSPEETEALLQGIEDGSVATSQGHGRPTGETRLYDFSDCERLARGTMPTLGIINARVARKLGKSVSELLRKEVEVTAGECRPVRFGEHMPSLPMPASLNLVRVRPLNSTLLVVPGHRLVQMCVDCFFGGKGTVADDTPAREFTAVEQRIINLLLERFLEAFCEGWQPVLGLSAEIIGQEQNPHFAAIANSGDRVLVNDFVLQVAGHEATLQLIVPRVMLDPVAEQLDSAPRNDEDGHDEAWARLLRRRFGDASLEVRAALTQTTLRLGDVLALRPGDVVPVELPDEIVLEAAGTPLFTGRAGASRNRNALEVTGRAETPDNDDEKRTLQ